MCSCAPVGRAPPCCCLRSQRRNININKVTKYLIYKVSSYSRVVNITYYVWQTGQTGPPAPAANKTGSWWGNHQDQLVVGVPVEKMTTQSRSVRQTSQAVTNVSVGLIFIPLNKQITPVDISFLSISFPSEAFYEDFDLWRMRVQKKLQSSISCVS